jgi:hypothetical protein
MCFMASDGVGGGRIDFSTGGVSNQYMRLSSNGRLLLSCTTDSDFLLRVSGDIGPHADGTYHLGSSSLRWQHLYLGGLLMGSSASVASASTVTLATRFVTITGSTTINHITVAGIPSGTVIILQFSSAPTVTHNAGAPPVSTAAIYLAGSSNFAATANDTLTLVFNGTVWCETARTAI